MRACQFGHALFFYKFHSKMTYMPKISVVMCTYNGGKYLKEQLDSILEQSYPVDEIIIQDDCSTDDTVDILRGYEKKYDNIHVYVNEKNLGFTENFWSVLGRAVNEYIAISDQDDIWLPDKIERQMNKIGDRFLCGGRSVPFSTTGVSIRVDSREPNCHLLRAIFMGCIDGHTMLIRKRLLDMIPVDERGKKYTFCSYDAMLTIVAAAYDAVTYINDPLVYHRRYVEAATYSAPSDNRKTIGNIIRTTFRTFKLYIELRPVLSERMQWMNILLRKIKSDKQILREAIELTDYMSREEGGLRGLINFLHIEILCIRHCDKLFYVPLKKNFTTILRGGYFPIYRSEYMRYKRRKH